MSRLDHIAYRVADRHKTVKFFLDAFGYKIQTEFEIEFEDGSRAECFALEPPEKDGRIKDAPWTWHGHAGTLYHERYQSYAKSGKPSPNNYGYPVVGGGQYSTSPQLRQLKHTKLYQEYHLAPEIFVSDGTPDSIVGKWVADRDGVGGIHHIAYMVESVKETMAEWKEKGYAEFTTEEPMKCPGLTQVFTKPSELTGVIYEFIEREAQGFCKENVKDLMKSTEGL